MSAPRPFEEPVLISEWLDDPITVDILESILAERVDLGAAGRKPRARLAIRDDGQPFGQEKQQYQARLEKLHERDAAVWLVARLRERYP